MFSIDGIVSGFNTTAIIEGLLSIQQSQVARLNLRKSDILDQQSAFKGIEARLVSLRTAMTRLNRASASVFDVRQASSSDEDIIQATAGSKAPGGSYTLRVNSLAAAHQIGSQGFDSQSATITEGDIAFQVGDREAVNLTIDSSNNTLSALVTAINDLVDDISATVVHDQASDTYRIVLTSRFTGQSNEISITNNLAPSSGNAVRPDFSGPAIQEAANASIQLGTGPGAIVAEYDSNQVEGLIEKVTLNLISADPGRDVTINIDRDNRAAKEAITEFVDEYNALMEFIDDQISYNPETQIASPLLGIRSVNTIQDRIRQQVIAVVPGLSNDLNRLSQLGIEIDTRGRLSVSASRLEAVLNGEDSRVAADDVRRLFGLTGSSSNPNLRFVIGGSATQASETPYQVDIIQAAEHGLITGGVDLSASVVIDGTNDQLQISVDGQNSDVLTLQHGTYSQQDLADHLQTVINSAESINGRKVTVSLEGNRLEIASDSWGTQSTIADLSGSAISTLGFDGSEAGTGQDVAGTFIVNGQTETAVGSGRLLIGDSENEYTADLQLEVTLDSSQIIDGPEGEITVTRGISSLINQYISDILDPIDGTIKTITDDFNQRIESLDQSIERIVDIAEAKREYLIREFAALERVLGELQTTSNFLSTQLNSLTNFANLRRA